MTAVPPPLQIDLLCKQYHGSFGRKGVQALSQVTLELQRGEIFGLLGPNGAGKTTLVKIVLGLLFSDSGEVKLFGKSSLNPDARWRVGYLPENHRFPPRIHGKALIKLAGRLHGMSDREIDVRSEELLERVDMSRWATTRISRYSKGMAQRIGIAQSLIHNPDLVILDEPTDGVDPVGRAEVGKIIRELKAEGKTALINSHSLAELEHLCDRVGILNKGELIMVGEISELTKVGPEYEIGGDFSTLEGELPRGIVRSSKLDGEMLSVSLVSEDKLDELTDWLRGKGVSIQSLTRRKLSLEDVFVKLIDDAERKDRGSQ